MIDSPKNSDKLRHFVFGHLSVAKLRRGLKVEIKRMLFEDPKPLLKEVEREAKKIREEYASWAVDAPATGHLEYASQVLAAYRVLLPRIGIAEATLSFIKAATMTGMNQLPLRKALQAFIRACRKNPDRLYRAFAWIMQQYGARFTWEEPHEHKDNHCQWALKITRCFYFDFFQAAGVPKLTQALCQIDALWFNQIKAQRDGFYLDTQEYNTQGYGGEFCYFPIKSVAKPEK